MTPRSGRNTGTTLPGLWRGASRHAQAAASGRSDLASGLYGPDTAADIGRLFGAVTATAAVPEMADLPFADAFGKFRRENIVSATDAVHSVDGAGCKGFRDHAELFCNCSACLHVSQHRLQKKYCRVISRIPTIATIFIGRKTIRVPDLTPAPRALPLRTG